MSTNMSPITPHTAPDLALIEAKSRMRNDVLGRRDAMSAAGRVEDAALCRARLLALPAFINAKTVLCYMSFGTEIDTQTIFAEALKQNKVVALPRMIKDQSPPYTPRLALHEVSGESELVSGKWGIREPRATCPAVPFDVVDLVLVPGVAFDRRGHRLGYGKGYYDRLLPARRPNSLLVALAFDCQLVDEVPVSAHDVSIDLLITPSQQLSFST
jgi:5-formyltetrahydrofolate cyclo-ligase